MDWAFWQALIQDSLHVANKTPHLLSIKLRAGIPPHARGLIWQAVCQSDCLHLETVYGQLCKEHSPHERVIKRDLTRTFPNVDMFKEENGPGQLALYRILVAYSLYDAHVGYCQGLAFLVGPLLMNMPEPQAFCVFVRMMETYEMRSMFTLDMEGLQVRLYQFSRLLEEHIPNLAAHLNKHSIHAAMYASQWFLTLFAYAFPLDLVSRIYDILFVEGATETMMRVSIAMLQRSEQAILAEDEFEDLLDCVTTRKLCAHYQEDWSEAIYDAMSLSNKITRQKLDGLEQQYAQQGQQEKKKTEQVLVSRLGNFWRRKSTKSSLARSVSDGGGGNNGGTGRSMKKKNTGINQTRNSIHSVDNVYSSVVMPPTPLTAASTNDHHDDITEELLQALEQLRREHSRTIDELFETRMDKKDVESERDALKMTIMELERRYQTSPPQSVPLDTTISSDSTIINDQPLTLLEDDDVNNDNTLVSYSNNVISTTSSYQTSSTDDLFYELASSSKKGVSQLTGTSLLTTTDESDGNALRTELVRIKVDHFESQQQCERLGQEVEDLQSRLDMVNEGQLALVDKLVSMKSEMDDLLLYKKRQDEKWQDLVEENSQLTIQLQQQQPAMDYLVDRIDELETSLAATKVRLAELEASADHRPSDHMILSTSLTNDGVSINDGGRLARSGSLYGRMWHVISPRSQALKSS
ncbi:rab-GTPase-TBC domain-containing protein [Chlamydoabsidia padenii]|nr:rab-GTPase-TBC domain-containing protein [Chlamydoabsidia padenii]